MSQGQWTIDSWLTVSQKLSLAHIGSEDICDLVTSLVLKEVLSIIVTHIPLLQSSRKEFFFIFFIFFFFLILFYF